DPVIAPECGDRRFNADALARFGGDVRRRPAPAECSRGSHHRHPGLTANIDERGCFTAPTCGLGGASGAGFGRGPAARCLSPVSWFIARTNIGSTGPRPAGGFYEIALALKHVHSDTSLSPA